MRTELVQRRRQGEAYSALSRWLVNEGYPHSRDSVINHLRKCAGLDDSAEVEAPQARSLLTASAISSVFERWPNLAQECAELLYGNGLHDEAAVVLWTVPEMMRKALQGTDGTPASALVEGRALALACRSVLPAHPHAAQAVAAHLLGQGADDLADAVLGLTDISADGPDDDGEPALSRSAATTAAVLDDL